jgi:hypothetical protein
MGVGKIMPASRGRLFVQLIADNPPVPQIGRKPPSTSRDGRFYQELPETAKKAGDVIHRPPSSLQPQ